MTQPRSITIEGMKKRITEVASELDISGLSQPKIEDIIVNYVIFHY